MENWEKAIKLQHYIGKYVAKGFRESIQVYSSVPYVLEQDFIDFEEAYLKGNLYEVIKNKRITFGGKEFEIYRFDRRDIIEAIESYFKEKK